MRSIEDIRQAIIADPENKDFTKRGIFPLFETHETARIVLVGQAPGSRAEATGLYFRDPSGDNLRAWLGVDEEMFYESGLFAVVPMDFYFPGSGKSGDLPPRKDFADKWHADILAQMPNVELMILIGQYAQHYYLKQRKMSVTTKTFFQITSHSSTLLLVTISGKSKILGFGKWSCLT